MVIPLFNSFLLCFFCLKTPFASNVRLTHPLSLFLISNSLYWHYFPKQTHLSAKKDETKYQILVVKLYITDMKASKCTAGESLSVLSVLARQQQKVSSPAALSSSPDRKRSFCLSGCETWNDNILFLQFCIWQMYFFLYVQWFRFEGFSALSSNIYFVKIRILASFSDPVLKLGCYGGLTLKVQVVLPSCELLVSFHFSVWKS